MRSAALIPVKELTHAKARLSSVLDSDERRALTLAMLRDVLDAALACSAIETAAVVSRDEAVLALAREAGAEGLAEPGGLNEALTSAGETMRQRGFERLIVVAADLPLATPEAIEAIATADVGVALVPSGDGGTNALALRPGTIPFAFGPDSANAHSAAAERAALTSQRLDLPDLALDIDSPEDLTRLRQSARAGRHTMAALERSVAPGPQR